jgi:leucyl aminopeptidase
MNIDLVNEIKCDIKVEFIQKKTLKKHKLYKTLKAAGFSAEQESICFLHEKRVLVCGVEDESNDNTRSACSVAIKALKSSNYKSASFTVNSTNIGAIIEGVVLGGYEYSEYKSKPKKVSLKNIYLTCKDISKIKDAFENAVIIAEATCYTRDIVNMTPEDLNPPTFADLAKKLAKENKLKCEILSEKELKREKMGSMLAVGRASRHDSKLIHLTYKPKNPKKVISLIGKGLTYDSGGLSLKPAASMVTMKMDKAGGCAVLGMIKAASEMKLDVEIHVFIGAVENMIGGNAYKPDDVLVARSGTTIEVRNTDAEGRLVLADVLDYAQEKVKADYMFDFATLTGACMVALGQYTTGVMGHSTELKHAFMMKAANESGELIGHLPFNRHLGKLLKSGIADISNVASKPYGGAITAGMFLDKFIKEENKEKWLHFDIAGSAYTDTPWDCNVYGGTGAGVRFMSSFLQSVK